MNDCNSYYEMMGTSEAEEKSARHEAEEMGWSENTHMEGFSNSDGYDNIHAKTWKQLCEDEGIAY